MLAVAALLLAPLAPAAALAKRPWVVRDVTGSKLATVRTISATKGKILLRGGQKAVANPSGKRGQRTAWGYVRGEDKGSDAVLVQHAALWHRTPAWRLVAFGEAGPRPIIGRIGLRGGRWLVQAGSTSAGWTTRGSVKSACPPWLVGGAVYLALISAEESW